MKARTVYCGCRKFDFVGRILALEEEGESTGYDDDRQEKAGWTLKV